MTENSALDRYASRRSTVYANRGMVVTSQPLAAEVGVSVLRDGGSAFDAAVATAARCRGRPTPGRTESWSATESDHCDSVSPGSHNLWSSARKPTVHVTWSRKYS